MVIYGILGGIGSGKTLAMLFLSFQDAVKYDKTILSNIKLEVPNFKLITPSILQAFGKKLKNTSIALDEIHNFMDSRDSSKKNNKKRSHWILQSRHAGKGSLDIYYTTQFTHQVDKRLRNCTDVWVYPCIIKRDEKERPIHMLLTYRLHIGQKQKILDEMVYIEPFLDKYDTHEIVEMET